MYHQLNEITFYLIDIMSCKKKELSFVASSLFSRDFSVDWTRSERSREWNINNLDMRVILIVAASLTDECDKIVFEQDIDKWNGRRACTFNFY
jgi:hypothetical protein